MNNLNRLTDRIVERGRFHKVRPAGRGREGDSRVKWYRSEGLIRADHRQVRQQSE